MTRSDYSSCFEHGETVLFYDGKRTITQLDKPYPSGRIYGGKRGVRWYYGKPEPVPGKVLPPIVFDWPEYVTQSVKHRLVTICEKHASTNNTKG